MYQIKIVVRKYIPQLENWENRFPLLNITRIVHPSKSKPLYKNMHREYVVLNEEQTWHILTNNKYESSEFFFYFIFNVLLSKYNNNKEEVGYIYIED